MSKRLKISSKFTAGSGSPVWFSHITHISVVVTRSEACSRYSLQVRKNKKDGYRQLNVRQLGSLRPCDHRGKCYMDRKRIQCLSNASQHVPIYLQPFLRYSELLVENCDIFRPNLCLAATQGVTPLDFCKDLDIHKTRMNVLSCGEESITVCSAVLIQYQRVTDGQTVRLSGPPAYIYYVLQHS